MASNKKKSGKDLIIKSIGVCIARLNDKKKPDKVVIAYKTGDKIDSVSFLFAKMPTKTLLNRNDFLSIIAKAEGAKNITYISNDGSFKDIYICREDEGSVIDIVERDYENNRYVEGFSEIFTSSLKFAIEKTLDFAKSCGKAFKLTISAGIDAGYTKNSYEYAIINAYNACLLGSLFEREELQLETHGGQKIKLEFRRQNTSFFDSNKLYIYPIFKGLSECVDYYQTEEFSYIDGNDLRAIVYRISYTNRLNDYNLVRV